MVGLFFSVELLKFLWCLRFLRVSLFLFVVVFGVVIFEFEVV